MSYPQIFRVRQTFAAPCIEDVWATTQTELSRLHLVDRIHPGQQVAITAGSRGIANIHLIIKAIVEHLKSLGAQPFIVPAMGSHGGATAQGQREVIESYGITEEFCGCPIRSSMETTTISHAKEGFPVHFDKFALAADHVVVVNRVKPHTGFVGDIESGLMKMMLIGLGNHAGAKIYHRAIVNYSFGQIVRSVAQEVLSRCRVVFGLAVVENAYDQTALIRAIEPQEFEDRERELLILAKQWMPRLPFMTADVLIVDEIGKNISGVGMDTNVIGRKFNDHEAMKDEWPKCRRIVVRGLTLATHGNANGIGMSEFCRTRAIEQMDRKSTRLNSLTAGHPTAAMLPIDFSTDRDCLDAALSTIGLVEPQNARLMWIHNTLDIAEVECSVAYLSEMESRQDLEIIVPARSLPLDAEGNLPDNNWAKSGISLGKFGQQS
ncbi:lactate racemase domain-containing protein [Aerosakkonemataceae cyanobacterium BLCC-F154]|uniref:Lactate racemase domain-containing protein n=1 Tax=Floridaenema fluviatile BLCC-F154 TaxID=3153640 RepID=A0ABV4YHE2_9CYAN